MYNRASIDIAVSQKEEKWRREETLGWSDEAIDLNVISTGLVAR